jgi:hypothetical protein
MANNMTKAALNKRAIGGIAALDRWVELLSIQLSKQTLPPEKQPGTPWPIHPPQSSTVTLQRVDVENLLRSLHDNANSMRQFTWRD